MQSALLAPRQMPALRLRCIPPHPAPCSGTLSCTRCSPCTAVALHTSMQAALLAPRKPRELRLHHQATPRAMQWHPILHALHHNELCINTAQALHTRMQYALLAPRPMPALRSCCTQPSRTAALSAALGGLRCAPCDQHNQHLTALPHHPMPLLVCACNSAVHTMRSYYPGNLMHMSC
jgi:hypothetical protein